jgi:hypothetical protein
MVQRCSTSSCLAVASQKGLDNLVGLGIGLASLSVSGIRFTSLWEWTWCEYHFYS